MNSLAAQPLAEAGDFAYPFWSPDSRHLAFFADGKLKKVSADGGPAQILCDAPNARGGSWAPAKDGGPGTIVFAPDRYVALYRVSAAGGEPVQLTALDSSRQQVSHRQPEFLPDGRHFLYAARDKAEKSEVFIGDLQAKPDPRSAHLLMGGVVRASYAPPGYLLFVHENNLIAQPFDVQRLELSGEPLALANHVDAHLDFNTSNFSVSTNGVLAWRSQSGAEVRQLAWFNRTGKQLPGLDAREPYTSHSLSPDGNRIAVKRWDLQSFTGNIWLVDLVRGSASGFTFGPRNYNSAVWSPNGSWIAFHLAETLVDYRMYRKDASGAGDEQLLLKTTQPPNPTDWSPDGRFILFTQYDPKASEDIWLLPLTGDRKPVPVLQTEFYEGEGVFSPDGHWIAYVSDESGRGEVYVRSFNEAAPGATVGKWPVSTAGGTAPRLRRDGKELFYLAPDGKLMAVPVKAGSTFEVGVPVALFNAGEGSQYAVSAEGGRFLISRVIERRPPGPVNICMNWLAGIKK
jgi:eukaryotic-like serine/threonine-protein kinase